MHLYMYMLKLLFSHLLYPTDLSICPQRPGGDGVDRWDGGGYGGAIPHSAHSLSCGGGLLMGEGWKEGKKLLCGLPSSSHLIPGEGCLAG